MSGIGAKRAVAQFSFFIFNKRDRAPGTSVVESRN